jgi:glycine cleavage system aminomethyltransferase T
MFADGGSDDAASVRQQLANMRDQDIDVFGFGVTQSGRAMEAVYAPYGQTIPDASKLAEAGIQQLVKTIKKWYNV